MPWRLCQISPPPSSPSILLRYFSRARNFNFGKKTFLQLYREEVLNWHFGVVGKVLESSGEFYNTFTVKPKKRKENEHFFPFWQWLFDTGGPMGKRAAVRSIIPLLKAIFSLRTMWYTASRSDGEWKKKYYSCIKMYTFMGIALVITYHDKILPHIWCIDG